MASFFEIAPGVYLLLALLLLTLPLPWLLAAAAAAGFHELCHWMAVLLSGGSVLRLQADIGGMVMEVSPLTIRQELICALAGPFGSLLLVLLMPWLPRLAVCGMVQGLFNLLPLGSFDGGRILRCALTLMKSDSAAGICRAVERWLPALLWVLGFVLNWGMLAVIVPLLLWLREKFLAKPPRCVYNRMDY